MLLRPDSRKHYTSFKPASQNKPIEVPLRYQPDTAVRNGNGGYNNNNNTRFGGNGYFYHAFAAEYTKCQVAWAVGFASSPVSWELFVREYEPGIGNQSVSSATQNPILDSILNITGPQPGAEAYGEHLSPIFDVTPGNLYELGCLRLSGGNVRLYSANVFFLVP